MRLRAAVETIRLNLSYTKVHAPISGRIDRNLVDVGNLVGANEPTLLATIVRDDPIYAYFNVSERDLLYYQGIERNRQRSKNSNNLIPCLSGPIKRKRIIPIWAILIMSTTVWM